MRRKYIGVYVQDEFQIMKRFNLHAVLRWEPLMPERYVAGRGQHSSVPVFIAGEKTAKYTNAAPGTPIQSCGAGHSAVLCQRQLGFAHPKRDG
jgi:hypothetical protein